MSDVEATVVGLHPLVEQLADILTRSKYIFDHQRGGYRYTASRSRIDRLVQSFPERLRGRIVSALDSAISNFASDDSHLFDLAVTQLHFAMPGDIDEDAYTEADVAAWWATAIDSVREEHRSKVLALIGNGVVEETTEAYDVFERLKFALGGQSGVTQEQAIEVGLLLEYGAEWVTHVVPRLFAIWESKLSQLGVGHCWFSCWSPSEDEGSSEDGFDFCNVPSELLSHMRAEAENWWLTCEVRGPGVNGITVMLHDSGALIFVAKISRQPTGSTEEQLDSVVAAMATLAALAEQARLSRTRENVV